HHQIIIEDSWVRYEHARDYANMVMHPEIYKEMKAQEQERKNRGDLWQWKRTNLLEAIKAHQHRVVSASSRKTDAVTTSGGEAITHLTAHMSFKEKLVDYLM
ncbi:hypothetical protein HK102_013262, partial [Quaeritorhiza haematococci]